MSSSFSIFHTHVPTTKRKKFPACDNCKARRVLCHSQPAGIPCPRCLEKGLECSTTPIVRRRRRTKAELQRAKLEAEAANRNDAESSATASTPSANGDSEERRSNTSQSNIDNVVPALWGLMQRYALTAPTLPSPSLDLPASLVAELFQTFRMLPQCYHPIVPVDRLETALHRSAWRLSVLSPQDRVLAQCILAVSSLFSLDSHIVGSMEQFDVHARSSAKADLREYGRRRETICQQLRGEAVKFAVQEGITVHISQENAASCALLEFLEYRATGRAATPYLIACNAHIRTMQEDPELSQLSLDSSDEIRWHLFLMQDALCALSCGKSIPFTKHDELLLYGEESYTIEEVFEILLSERSTVTQVSSVRHALFSYVIHLARECSERLTGAYARRQSLNEAALTLHLTSLNTLHAVVKAYKTRSEALLGKAGAEGLLACIYAGVIAWTSLVLPLYAELERRYSANSASSLAEIGDDGMDWSRARLELHYKQVRGMALKASVELAGALSEVPICYLTHVTFGDVGKAARLLLESTEATEITPMERVQALGRIRDALKLAGFALIDRTGLVEAIEIQLPSVASESEQGLFSFSAIQSSSTVVDDSSTSLSMLWGPNVFPEPFMDLTTSCTVPGS